MTGSTRSPPRRWSTRRRQATAGKHDSPERRIDVHVVEVYGDIATAVVDSHVYREYVHLVRTDGDWKIVNALWAFT